MCSSDARAILWQGYSAENGGQSLMGNDFSKSFNFL